MAVSFPRKQEQDNTIFFLNVVRGVRFFSRQLFPCLWYQSTYLQVNGPAKVARLLRAVHEHFIGRWELLTSTFSSIFQIFNQVRLKVKYCQGHQQGNVVFSSTDTIKVYTLQNKLGPKSLTWTTGGMTLVKDVNWVVAISWFVSAVFAVFVSMAVLHLLHWSDNVQHNILKDKWQDTWQTLLP